MRLSHNPWTGFQGAGQSGNLDHRALSRIPRSELVGTSRGVLIVTRWLPSLSSKTICKPSCSLTREIQLSDGGWLDRSRIVRIHTGRMPHKTQNNRHADACVQPHTRGVLQRGKFCVTHGPPYLCSFYGNTARTRDKKFYGSHHETTLGIVCAHDARVNVIADFCCGIIVWV